jgi:ubiquitin carboxyl-terminal hydrolase L3
MAESFEWPALEGNPEIFTEYMRQTGMSSSWAFGEVFGFDEELLAFLPSPIMAVIANVERIEKLGDKSRGDPAIDMPFYMKQTDKLDNACGIIACLHALYNNPAVVSDLADGSILANHLTSVLGLSPEARAAALESNTAMQAVHRERANDGGSQIPQEQHEVKNHFVAFVVDDLKRLIELDGTKAGPVVVAEGCEDVLRGTIAEIQRRLAANEISDRLALLTLNPASD